MSSSKKKLTKRVQRKRKKSSGLSGGKSSFASTSAGIDFSSDEQWNGETKVEKRIENEPNRLSQMKRKEKSLSYNRLEVSAIHLAGYKQSDAIQQENKDEDT